MATTHGKSGKVQVLANAVAAVTSWTGTYDPKWAALDALGDSFSDQIAGIASMTGNVNCNTDKADTNGQELMHAAVTGHSTVRLYLYINTTDYWEFNAHLDLVDTVDIGDVVKRVFNFRSSSTIALN